METRIRKGDKRSIKEAKGRVLDRHIYSGNDKLVPGVASRHTLLYGVEVKSILADLSSALGDRGYQYVCDGAGVSRGLIQASASGVVVACEILRRRHD